MDDVKSSVSIYSMESFTSMVLKDDSLPYKIFLQKILKEVAEIYAVFTEIYKSLTQEEKIHIVS